MTSITIETVLAARETIWGMALETPLVPSPHLSRVAGVPFHLKLELAQPMGAFKIRGAANAVAALPHGAPGVVCCSTGNHGRGVAYAAARRGIRAVVCMSSLVPDAKVRGIRDLGAEVRIVGTSQDDAQAEATRLVAEEGLVDINPFDDPRVIAGQGTIGLELLEQLPDLATVVVPLSGGGLAGGIALAVKSRHPGVRVIGVSMDRGAAMIESIRAGQPVEVTEVASLADSLGGGIGLDNRHSFELCRRLLDNVVQVSEEEIYRALQTLYYEDRLVAEGGCVVGIAALQAGRLPASAGPVATIVTGRNIDMALHADIMAGRPVTLGDLTLPGEPYAA